MNLLRQRCRLQRAELMHMHLCDCCCASMGAGFHKCRGTHNRQVNLPRTPERTGDQHRTRRSAQTIFIISSHVAGHAGGTQARACTRKLARARAPHVLRQGAHQMLRDEQHRGVHRTQFGKSLRQHTGHAAQPTVSSAYLWGTLPHAKEAAQHKCAWPCLR